MSILPASTFGQVQDVVDELEQVRAGGVDDGRVLDLLGRQVARRVLRQQLGQDQQAVQWSPQLVRHVGEELGLVLRRQRQLLGSGLQLLAGLLDLQILGLDVPVLGDQQGGLFLELGIGALELLLPCLQFLRAGLQLGSQPLGLLEQLVGTGVGHDRVEVDADGAHQLFEERLLNRRELVRRGQLDRAEHLAFDHDRQHDHRAGGSPAQPRGDRHVVGGRVLQRDGALAARGLSDQ
jgi:hypothetical protein